MNNSMNNDYGMTGMNNSINYNTQPDIDCVVTYPSTWGPCSPSGVKSATGVITTYPSGNGAKCGPLTITGSCPVDCVVDYPQTWGSCSSSGVKTATGTIRTYPMNGGANCPPLTITGSCPVDCVVNYPSTWSSCSSSGVQTKTGIVVVPQMNSGSACPPLTLSQSCTPGPVYVGCYKDTIPRALPISGTFAGAPGGVGSGLQSLTISQCNSAAKAAGLKPGIDYFGIQYFQNTGETTPSKGQCFYGRTGTPLSTVAKYGEGPVLSVQDSLNMGNACTTGTDNMIYGAAGANAIYTVY